MRSVAATVVALSCGVWLGFGANAQAQDKRDEEKAKKEAKRLLFQGDAAFERKDFKGALLKYQQAYDAYQSAKIFYPMAQTEEKLGLELEAIHHYEQLLEEAGNEISPELRNEAKVRIEKIEQRLALVRFDLKPAAVRVIIDEIEFETKRPVRLKPGNHRYRLELEGYASVEGALDLKPGSREQVSRELKPDGSPKRPPVTKPDQPGKPPVVETPPEPEGRTGSGGPVLVGSIVATSILGGATVVTGILAVRKHGIYTDENESLAAREKARDKGKTLALATDLLLVGTIASAAFTTYWYFYVVKPENEWAASAAMAGRPRVTPYLSGEGGGVLLEGSF